MENVFANLPKKHSLTAENSNVLLFLQQTVSELYYQFDPLIRLVKTTCLSATGSALLFVRCDSQLENELVESILFVKPANLNSVAENGYAFIGRPCVTTALTLVVQC